MMMPECESVNPAPVLPPAVGQSGETLTTDFGPTIIHSRFPNCTPSHGAPLSLLPLPAGAALPAELPPVVSDVDFFHNGAFAPKGAVKMAWCRACHHQSDDAGCVCANRSPMISVSSSPQHGSQPRGGQGHISSCPSSSSESSDIRSSRFASLWGLGGGADWTWAPSVAGVGAPSASEFLATAATSSERLPVPTAAPPSPPSPRTESKIRRDSLPSPPGSGRTRRARATSPPSPSLVLPLRQSEDTCWGTTFMPTPPSTNHDVQVTRHDASWSMTTELTREMQSLGLDSRVVQGMCEVRQLLFQIRMPTQNT